MHTYSMAASAAARMAVGGEDQAPGLEAMGFAWA